MSSVLFTWELGAGLGHIGRLRPLAESLAARGHQVYFAMRDLTHSQEVFAGTSIACLQAPFKIEPPTAPIAVPRSLPHILHNVGFSNPSELSGLVAAWRTLLMLTKPDVVVIDHSPSALVALRGHPAKKVIVGTGFFIPPKAVPLPDLRPWLPPAAEQLASDEARILETINHVMERHGQPALGSVSDLYSEVDDQVLLTFPELDHYGVRPYRKYWGTWDSSWGMAPEWPAGNGPRVFGYLKPFRALPEVLTQLLRRALPTIVYAPSLSRLARAKFAGPTLRFVEQSQDLKQIRETCDLAILNATHGVAVELLLGGVPALHFPLMLEQLLLGRKFEDSQTGMLADCESPEQVEFSLNRFLHATEIKQGASDFARRYSFLDSKKQAELLGEHLHRLLDSDVKSR